MDFKNIDEGHPDGEEPLHFYYNREERLKKAPKIVQDYYAGKAFTYTGGVKGLFKSLVSTRMNRFMLLSLVFFFAAIYIFTFLSSHQNSMACGIPVELTCHYNGEQVFVTLCLEEAGKKKNQDKLLDEGKNLQVTFIPYDRDGNVSNEPKVFKDIKYSGKQLFINADFQDYDKIIKVIAEVSCDDVIDSVSASVKK